MKNFFAIFLVFSIIFSGFFLPNVSAQSSGSTIKTWTGASNASRMQPVKSVEDRCLEILGTYANQDARFRNINLWKIGLSAYPGHSYDLTKHNNFLRAARFNLRSASTKFYASRNNIGTIIAGNEYLYSRFVALGNDTSFVFPFPSAGSRELADSYGVLKEYILYTHHLRSSNRFMSCGLLKITPAPGKGHGDTHPDNYKTNTINESGFELLRWQDRPVIVDGNKYIVGKANVPIQNYNNEHQMTLEVMIVAYDNKSSYMNEYETFPLQVKAMTDMDFIGNGWANAVNRVQEKFLEYVKTRTCLAITTPNNKDLPAMCGWQPKSLSANQQISFNNKNIFANISNYFVPKVFAQEDNFIPADLEIWEDVPVPEGWIEKPEEATTVTEDDLPRGLYVNEGLRYDLLEKLNQLNNEELKQWVLLAFAPGMEKIMEMDSTGSTHSARNNQTFLQCGFSYDERVKLLTEWLEGIDINNFSVNNITYPDPKIGDCIIPFPDVRHKNQIISGSYLVNQYNAAVATNNSGAIAELEPVLEFGKYQQKPLGNSSNLMVILAIILIAGGLGTTVLLLKKKKSQK